MTTFFAGHPYRIGAAAIGFAAAAVLAWYLGSPLFIRTYTNEALPAVSAAPPRGASGCTSSSRGPTSRRRGAGRQGPEEAGHRRGGGRAAGRGARRARRRDPRPAREGLSRLGPHARVLEPARAARRDHPRRAGAGRADQPGDPRALSEIQDRRRLRRSAAG